MNKRQCWLISYCIEDRYESLGRAEFHFRGHLYGRWVNRVTLVLGNDKGKFHCEKGKMYLLHLDIIQHLTTGELEGRLLSSRLLNVDTSWEDF